MVIKNSSTFKGSDLKDEIIKKVSIKQLPRIISFGFILILCILFIIFTKDHIENIIVGSILLALDLAYFIYQIIQYVNIPKTITEKNSYINCDQILYNFTFKEQSFIVELCANGKRLKEEYYYNGIRKVTDKGPVYDILMRDGVSFYLTKDNFDVDKGLEFFHKYLNLHKIKFVEKKDE